jgi:hypothetical protein
MRLDETENYPIHDRPHRLHKIEHQRLLPSISPVEIPNQGTEPSREHGNSHLALQNRIAIIQHRVNRMRGVPIRTAFLAIPSGRFGAIPRGSASSPSISARSAAKSGSTSAPPGLRSRARDPWFAAVALASPELTPPLRVRLSRGPDYREQQPSRFPKHG